MNTLRDTFCLANERQNFQINVRATIDDRRVYFGRGNLNEQLIGDIEQRYEMGIPPKKYIHGLYGAGKTHTLFNIKDCIEEDPQNLPSDFKIRCRFVEAEFRKKTDYTYLHRSIMEGIGLNEVKGVVQRFIQIGYFSIFKGFNRSF